MEHENYLADWLSGKLSDAELKLLVTETDFKAYQKLKVTLEQYSLSEPDLERNYRVVEEKIHTQKKKSSSRVVQMWLYRGVAASLVLFFGWYLLFFQANDCKTDFGKTKTMVLSDDSSVRLQPNSSLQYPHFFQLNRRLTLKGEAYFEVAKGSQFTVTTAMGKVTVLGTKFTVTSFDSYFEVHCYEGKVKVTLPSKEVILMAGEVATLHNNTFEKKTLLNNLVPNWSAEETYFNNSPMHYVFEKFENQYGVTVVYPKEIASISFSGSFSNKNIQLALQSICIPLQLHYDAITSKNIIISR